MPRISDRRDIETIRRVAPQLDDTNKPAMSVYGKDAAAGDTPVRVSPSGHVWTVQGAAGGIGDNTSNTIATWKVENGTSYFLRGIAPTLFNGSTWDRVRNNAEFTILQSAVRSGTLYSDDLVNYNAKGILLFFDITAVPGTDTVQLVVQVKDFASGGYNDFLVGTAWSTTGRRTYLLYPGAVNTSGDVDVVEGSPLPRTWRVAIIHSAATDFTYSVGGCYIN
jgi:hypothetical protein